MNRISISSDETAFMTVAPRSLASSHCRKATGMASSNGVNISYEDIAPTGNPHDTILLNMSMAADALIWPPSWPPSFIRTLTDAAYRVIRYDYRGTGMSDWMNDRDSKHPYSGRRV